MTNLFTLQNKLDRHLVFFTSCAGSDRIVGSYEKHFFPSASEGATKNATTDSFLSTPPVFPINAIVGFSISDALSGSFSKHGLESLKLRSIDPANAFDRFPRESIAY